MAVTIDGDFTTISAADSTTNWTGRSPISNLGITTSGQIEGAGCIDGRLAAGTGDATFNNGSTDYTDTHIYCWFRPSSPVDTFANAGVTMRVSGTAGGASNYGQWNVGGSDLGIVGSGGWINYTVDLLREFDTINGTLPAITAIIDSGVGGAFLSGPGMSQIVIDKMTHGTTAIVRGGTGGSPGTWAEAATADLANGHVKDIAGAIFINSRVRFGDSVGTTTTEFSDVDAVILFETNMLIAGDLAGFEFAGNATGTNNAQFGVSSGTGVNKVGGSGGTWKAAGDRPFRVEAKNTDMDSTGIFGVSMLGPSALWDDSLRNFKQEDSSGGPSFLDFTREANDSTANDASPFPAGAGVNDAAYFGHNVRWYELNVNTGTAGAGTYTITWEYYNGTAWSSLTDLTDGTSGFQTSGLQTVTFAIPDDWAKVDVDTDTRFWVRARRDAGTVTTDPDITQCTVALAGDIELEDSSAEMIDCVLSSMGAVRVRNGAFCKRTTIASSLTTAKHAALDLGGADPTADTVRDLTITNNTNGILLKGSGDVTYNFRNIQFAGNTKDVRVDFGSGDTVTINILESGDTPTLDNVNGSTVTINNAVSVDVHVEDSDGTAVQDAQVYIQKSTPTAFTSGAGNNAGDPDFVVTQTIDSDMPGTGWLIVFDDSANFIAPYRYASHDGVNTFTLEAELTGSTTSTGSNTSLISTSTNFLTADIDEGDTVRNTTDGSWAVVDEIIDVDNITTSPLIGGTDNTWQSSDAFSFHRLAVAYVSGATVDIPLMNKQTDASGDVTKNYNYSADLSIAVKVRSNAGATKYIPFKTTGTIQSGGFSTTVVLQEDTVAT